MKRMGRIAAAMVLAGGLGWEDAHAQLAITEVMAESATNMVPVFRGQDFWELTNFGPKDIDLNGYGFSDSNLDNRSTLPFTDLVIRAGESIIFCRTNATIPHVATPAKFKAWWGEQILPPGLKVRFYNATIGFDGDIGDEIWLTDPDDNVVDMVAFGASPPLEGSTFAYDLQTGTLGPRSVPEVNRAFRAFTNTNDVGSPGFTTGAVPLSILRQPVSQTVEGCGTATFSVAAGGLPRPRFQWTVNGISIDDATGPTLVLPDVQVANAGAYRVMLDNGLMQMTSAPAILTVNTNPLAPSIVRLPLDNTVFPEQRALFSVEGRGFPCLHYQWHENGVAIPGATSPTLEFVVPFDSPLSTTTYTVTVWNGSGSTNASARLTVTRRPCLSITELMSSPTNEATSGHRGWFELTNCDTQEVDLRGYRFRDDDSLDASSTNTNAVIIKPGESVIFVEFMSAEEFIRWWGAENLPPGLQIITWGGWGLSAQGQDVVYVWNPGATEPWDSVANASHARAIEGVSQELENYCDGDFGCTATYLRYSGVGTNGAFRADMDGDGRAGIGRDVGSPGYTANPPPRFLRLTRDSLGVVKLGCRVVEGKTYQLQFKNAFNALRDPGWFSLISFRAPSSIITVSDFVEANLPTRFYRLKEWP